MDWQYTEERQQRIECELDASRAWRAKEIASGWLDTFGYRADLCELYGRILLHMNDDLEAGRYLLLSGSAKPEHAAAIQLFRDRFGHLRGHDVLGLLPSSFRATGFDQLHPAAQAVLSEWGLKAKDIPGASSSGKIAARRCASSVGATVVYIVLVSIVGLFIYGLVSLITDAAALFGD